MHTAVLAFLHPYDKRCEKLLKYCEKQKRCTINKIDDVSETSLHWWLAASSKSEGSMGFHRGRYSPKHYCSKSSSLRPICRLKDLTFKKMAEAFPGSNWSILDQFYRWNIISKGSHSRSWQKAAAGGGPDKPAGENRYIKGRLAEPEWQSWVLCHPRRKQTKGGM